jgi:hypothetical protein
VFVGEKDHLTLLQAFSKSCDDFHFAEVESNYGENNVKGCDDWIARRMVLESLHFKWNNYLSP